MPRPATRFRYLRIINLLRGNQLRRRLNRKEVAFMLNITYSNLAKIISRCGKERRKSPRLYSQDRRFNGVNF